jgi:TolB-like protein/DNA-binding winged helix-turn-helix (wHTH) protein/Flp pilus assembly protein TadD
MLNSLDIASPSDSPETTSFYLFGEFKMDLTDESLWQNGEKLRINRRSFQVLRLLIERAGQIVTKQEFFHTVWADAFVEDNSLTVTMTALRKILGDDYKQPKFIENLPRKGYRFIGEVKTVSDESPIAQVEEKNIVAPTADVGKKTVSNSKNRKALIGLFAAFLIFLLAVLGFKYFGSSQSQFISINNLQIKSVAVLPFENQNPDTEYLSDGLTESVINNLSGLSNLRVISRNSVFQYKNKQTDSMTIGRELNVGAVLTGRFVQRGDDLTINAELTDARDNKQIWGRQYNRQTSDAFALQQEIARDISDALRSKLSGEEKMRLAKSETDSPEAFQLYLKGRYQWNKRTAESFRIAVDFFNQAIEKDPTYALPYVGLANCYLSVNYKYVITREERVAMVKAAANKALEIDPKLDGEVHAVLAINSHFNEWDWANADREYKLAVELSPNYATAHHWYAEFLATEGRFDESFAEYQRALELDPLSLAVKTDLGLNYYYARQFDRAAEYLKKLKESEPNYLRTYVFLAMVYKKKEMFEEAIAEDDRAYTLNGSDLQMLASRKTALENAFKTAGAKGYWQKVLDLEFDLQSGKPNPVTMAKIYSELGERDKAFELLEKGYSERSPLLVWLKVSPEFDGIRSDSRFTDLMRRVGLPQ